MTGIAEEAEAKPFAKTKKLWAGEIVEHKGFKDLGNYVIELPDYTDPATLERGLAAGNAIVPTMLNFQQAADVQPWLKETAKVKL